MSETATLNDRAYEDRLGDALESVLGAGAQALEEIAAGLNALGVFAPGSQAQWTPDSLQAELHRLAQVPHDSAVPEWREETTR